MKHHLKPRWNPTIDRLGPLLAKRPDFRRPAEHSLEERACMECAFPLLGHIPPAPPGDPFPGITLFDAIKENA